MNHKALDNLERAFFHYCRAEGLPADMMLTPEDLLKGSDLETDQEAVIRHFDNLFHVLANQQES